MNALPTVSYGTPSEPIVDDYSGNSAASIWGAHSDMAASAKSGLWFFGWLSGASRCSCSERFTSHATPHLSKATYRATLPFASAASLLFGLVMRSQLLVLVVLVLLFYVPPGKMASLPCGIRSNDGKGLCGSTRVRPKQDKGSWDKEGPQQRWTFWVIPGSSEKITGGSSLERRSWFWILVWGVCEVCGEGWTDMGRSGVEWNDETFGGQVVLESGKEAVSGGFLELALPSQLSG